MPNPKYAESAQTSLHCLGVRANETVLIITDVNKLAIAWSLFDAALDLDAAVQLVRIPVAKTHGCEPPEPLSSYMKQFDVIIAPTTKSISHTQARRAATKKGVRIATMPDITEDTFLRAMKANYHLIAERGRAIAEKIRSKSTVRVKSAAGTDLTFSIANRDILIDSGLAHTSGDFCNLPAGEVYMAPLEGTAQGKAVIEGSMAGIGLLDEPLILKFINGKAESIEGKHARQLIDLIEPFGENAFMLAELGIGTNDKAKICGSVLEDEKVIGTCHIAIGDNRSMGGDIAVESHLDGAILKPTIYADNELIMENGEIL